MEDQKGKGGKRPGAGRKPIGHDKKVQISLYVPEKKIWPYGNAEKLKMALYKFIDGERVTVMTVQDLNQPTNQIKPQEQPKTNYQAVVLPKPEVPLKSPHDAFREEILTSKSIKEIEAVMRRIKATPMPFPRLKELEALAKQHSLTMYND